MDTLSKLRPHDQIKDYTKPINEKNDMAYLHTALIENPGTIFVVKDYVVDIMDKFLEEVDGNHSGYIFFQIELDLDPVNNHMVARHRYATADEIAQLEATKIPMSKLPVLCMKDPIRRWHNFTVNSVIAIERRDKLYFRLCK